VVCKILTKRSSGTARNHTADILQELQAHPYVKAPFPKSTGPEVFGVDLIWQIIAKYRIEPVQYYDLLATFSRFSAEAVYTNYHQFFADKYPLDEIIASGGGVHNPVIMEHLQTCSLGEDCPAGGLWHSRRR
jgi:anhydro-N-acetylmuramic acid kinase